MVFIENFFKDTARLTEIKINPITNPTDIFFNTYNLLFLPSSMTHTNAFASVIYTSLTIVPCIMLVIIIFHHIFLYHPAIFNAMTILTKISIKFLIGSSKLFIIGIWFLTRINPIDNKIRAIIRMIRVKSVVSSIISPG